MTSISRSTLERVISGNCERLKIEQESSVSYAVYCASFFPVTGDGQLVTTGGWSELQDERQCSCASTSVQHSGCCFPGRGKLARYICEGKNLLLGIFTI